MHRCDGCGVPFVVGLFIGIALFSAGAACANAGTPDASSATTSNPGSGSRGGGSHCVLPVGDLNGDGRTDYASAGRTAKGRPEPIAYVIFGKSIPPPAALSETELEAQAAFVLRGAAAAPFACTERRLPRSGGLVQDTNSVHPSVHPAIVLPPFTAWSPWNRPPRYRMVDLNELSASGYVVANGLGASGGVVGQYINPEGEEHAILYDGIDLHDLGTLGGHYSAAFGINRLGDIVGESLTGETDERGFVSYAFIADASTMDDLGLRWSWARKINDAGQVVGGRVDDLGHSRAYLYAAGKAIDLTAEGDAYSINASGQVVGEFGTRIPKTGEPSVRAFLFEEGRLRDLGSLGYDCTVIDGGSEQCREYSAATDVNTGGQVVGFSTTEGFGTHAFLREGDTLRDIGTLGGGQSWAYSVNDSGQVVGTSLNRDETAYAAFLFEHGTLYDLNTLIANRPDKLSIWTALDINNFGQIAGANFRLDPIYDYIVPGSEFSFRATLGRLLRFEYWAERGADACGDRPYVAVRLDVAGFRVPRRHGRQWRPPERSLTGCPDINDWQRVAVAIPQILRGRHAQIAVNAFGDTGSVIYLRHFSME